MAKSANMYIRIDPKIKADVEAIYAQYGMSVTDAINIFLYQSRNIGGLPFDLRPPKFNAETLTAIREVEDMKSGKIPKNHMSVEDFIKETETDD